MPRRIIFAASVTVTAPLMVLASTSSCVPETVMSPETEVARTRVPSGTVTSMRVFPIRPFTERASTDARVLLNDVSNRPRSMLATIRIWFVGPATTRISPLTISRERLPPRSNA